MPHPLNVRQLGSVDGVATGAHLVELSLGKKKKHMKCLF